MMCAHQASKDEDLVSAARSRVAHSRWGSRAPSDDGGHPLHAVCVQNCDILQQLSFPLPTEHTMRHHLQMVEQDTSHYLCCRPDSVFVWVPSPTENTCKQHSEPSLVSIVILVTTARYVPSPKKLTVQSAPDQMQILLKQKLTAVQAMTMCCQQAVESMKHLCMTGQDNRPV